MTTLAQKKLDYNTLQIKDRELEIKYKEMRYAEVNKVSRKIVYARMIYLTFICA